MKSMRGGRIKGFLKYVVFSLLGMAVGGLVLSGSFNAGNVGGNDVAKIDEKTITIRQFDLTLRRAISRYGISAQEAYRLGMVEEILAGEIRANFMLKEAESLGIEITQDQLAKRIGQVVAPHKLKDQTLQDTLENLLRRQGMNEKDFVLGIKREVSGDIMSNAITSGFSPATDALAKDLYAFQTQTRDIDLILFDDSEVTSIPEATTEELERLYDSIKSAQYKIPEYRSVNIAIFDPSSIEIDFTLSEEEVKIEYEKNIQSFAIGEQLVLTQTIIDSEQKAQDIYALTEQGESLKDATIKIVGENGRYIEKSPFESTMILPALAKALEKRKIGKIIPPTKTALGYHIVKLEEILVPSIQPLKKVQSQIKKYLLENKKSDHLFEISTTFEDLLNDEVSFDNIAKEIDISISSIGLIDATGIDKDTSQKSGLEEYKSPDKEALIEMIFAVEEDLPSILEELPSGKFVSLTLISREQETYKPFKHIRPKINDKYIADQRRVENTRRMDKYLAELDMNGSTFKSIAQDNKKEIQTIKGITIEGSLPEPLSASNRPIIFKTALEGYQVLRLDGKSALIKISGYNFPKMDEHGEKILESIKIKVEKEGKDEAILVYLHMLSNKYNATINTKLLERAYGQQNDEN